MRAESLRMFKRMAALNQPALRILGPKYLTDDEIVLSIAIAVRIEQKRPGSHALVDAPNRHETVSREFPTGTLCQR